MSKISKNIKMLNILSSGKVYSCKTLSEMLEVSPRTVRQYKDELEKEGIYIDSVMGKNGGYKLYSRVEIPSILFNGNDIKKIELILNKLSGSDKLELENIKEKINTYCRLVSDKDDLCVEDKWKVNTIQEAINNKKKITIEYFSKGIKKSRSILPIQIYVYGNIIMVIVSYSEEPNDIRHLNLKRIENIII